MTADRVSDGARAKQALDHLAPAFDAVEGSYAKRMMEIAAETPWETGKITKLAMALKISRSVRAQIEAIAADGKLAEAEHQRAVQIEKIPAAKRWWLGV